jgi:hypothetical protein
LVGGRPENPAKTPEPRINYNANINDILETPISRLASQKVPIQRLPVVAGNKVMYNSYRKFICATVLRATRFEPQDTEKGCTILGGVQMLGAASRRVAADPASLKIRQVY